MKTIERARVEIEQGRLWRAKDILGGSLASYPYDPQHYFAYGDLLFRMGDLRDAGRFLFLSGLAQEVHLHAVEIYLSQYKSSGKNDFYSSFPARARLKTLSDYPPSVAEELKRKGFGEVIRHPLTPPQPKTVRSKIKDGCLVLLAVVLLMLLGIGVLRGIVFGVETVYEWIKG